MTDKRPTLRLVPRNEKPAVRPLESSGVPPSARRPRAHLRTIKKAAEALLDDCRDVDLRAAVEGNGARAMLDALDDVDRAIAQLRQAAGRMLA